MNPDELREGIYALNTRRFGSLAEVMIARIVQLGKGKALFHDLYDDIEEKRVEVKFSRALRKDKMRVTRETVLDCIRDATREYRLVSYDKRFSTEFDCNIQQVKRTEFDVLYYGIFFADRIAIFRIESSEIGPDIYYSDKQHKCNVGEGQFHINQDTLRYHEGTYLYQTLTYQELLDVLTP